MFSCKFIKLYLNFLFDLTIFKIIQHSYSTVFISDLACISIYNTWMCCNSMYYKDLESYKLYSYSVSFKHLVLVCIYHNYDQDILLNLNRSLEWAIIYLPHAGNRTPINPTSPFLTSPFLFSVALFTLNKEISLSETRHIMFSSHNDIKKVFFIL